MRHVTYLSFICLLASMVQPLKANDILGGADLGYGEYLSSECVTCHKISGKGQGVPSISGVKALTLATKLHAYKSKKLDNQTMQLMAGNLDNEQIASLAVYFASLSSTE